MEAVVVVETSKEHANAQSFKAEELRVINSTGITDDILIVEEFHVAHKRWTTIAVFRKWDYWRWITNIQEFT